MKINENWLILNSFDLWFSSISDINRLILLLLIANDFIGYWISSIGHAGIYIILWFNCIWCLSLVQTHYKTLQCIHLIEVSLHPSHGRLFGFNTPPPFPHPPGSRPFYSCLKCNQAFLWKQGYGWPWNDRHKELASMITKLFTCEKVAKSTLASLLFRFLATNHTTVKWCIAVQFHTFLFKI